MIELKGPDDSHTAIIDVNLVDVRAGRIIPHQVVTVHKGKIAQVTPLRQHKLAPNARSIRASGKYLMPGLADMHVHIALPSRDSASENCLTQEDVSDQMFAHVANGVTTIRVMMGRPETLRLRRAIDMGSLIGPRIFTAGPALESVLSIPKMAEDFCVVKTPAEAISEVKRQKAERYDFVKVYNQLEPSVYSAIMRSAADLHLPVCGHVPFSVGVECAMKEGQQSIEHFRGYDKALDVRPASELEERFSGWLHTNDEAMEIMADRTVRSGVWNCPTFVVQDHLLPDCAVPSLALQPELEFFSDAFRHEARTPHLLCAIPEGAREICRSGLGNQKRFLKTLADVGAGILVGLDSPAIYVLPGFSYIDELRHFREAGLNNIQILRAATSSAADYLGRTDFGVIHAGARADLLLLDQSPYEDIENVKKIAGVMVRGRWLSRKSIDAKLRGMKKRNAARPRGNL